MPAAEKPVIKNIDANEVIRILPHRSPFLLIDSVSEVVPNEYIIAHKAISQNEPWAAGHFPGKPVFPGVLIIEAMAQATAIFGYYTIPNCLPFSTEGSSVLLIKVDKVRVRRKVVPGDVLTIHARPLQSRSKFYHFACEAFVGDEFAAEAEIVSFFDFDKSVTQAQPPKIKAST